MTTGREEENPFTAGRDSNELNRSELLTGGLDNTSVLLDSLTRSAI